MMLEMLQILQQNNISRLSGWWCVTSGFCKAQICNNLLGHKYVEANLSEVWRHSLWSLQWEPIWSLAFGFAHEREALPRGGRGLKGCICCQERITVPMEMEVRYYHKEGDLMKWCQEAAFVMSGEPAWNTTSTNMMHLMSMFHCNQRFKNIATWKALSRPSLSVAEASNFNW